jgi:hypothetical protein
MFGLAKICCFAISGDIKKCTRSLIHWLFVQQWEVQNASFEIFVSLVAWVLTFQNSRSCSFLD